MAAKDLSPKKESKPYTVFQICKDKCFACNQCGYFWGQGNEKLAGQPISYGNKIISEGDSLTNLVVENSCQNNNEPKTLSTQEKIRQWDADFLKDSERIFNECESRQDFRFAMEMEAYCAMLRFGGGWKF